MQGLTEKALKGLVWRSLAEWSQSALAGLRVRMSRWYVVVGSCLGGMRHEGRREYNQVRKVYKGRMEDVVHSTKDCKGVKLEHVDFHVYGYEGVW